MTQLKNAFLLLDDGTQMSGKSFGFEASVSGEVVFNTAMTGYPESLTDPSYKGQILVATYPLIGNYGVPELEMKNGLLRHFESEKIQVSGLVISDYSFNFSHWNAAKSLSDWLRENKVPAIFDVDTRALTKILRENGTMLGKIIIDDQDVELYDPNKEHLVNQVSIREPVEYGSGKHRILLIDCGVKLNIIRCLLQRDTTVIRAPYDQDISALDYDGLFLTNGPGDPKMCVETIASIKKAFENGRPIFGICLGSQLMALASGGDTFKLRYGHRSHNQPVLKSKSNRCYITSQNHGYAVDHQRLGSDWEPYFTNVNDQTCEGIIHKSKPFFSSQFHPEASSGPVDTEFLFDDFIQLIEDYK
ncbi:MAG: glutamine-hydrolyzing carbamoyl-phosphate synthase small subunit [Bacteroidota bacterium]|nr:glutamine-hydrolyzing carbamoyl-phosphate synthase small subunit [Bacteroidota bacterium]